MLFTVWSRQAHRATKDIDLLGYGKPDPERLVTIFGAVCDVPVPDDGIIFLASTLQAHTIREEAVYDGIRVTFVARLGTAKVPIQVDVGFGDSTNPPPELVEIPPLLDIPTTKMLGYRRELVVAEKFHAMVDLGISNSRMKDFFDIWFLARQFPFDGRTLVTAVTTTFERRKTSMPADPPLALTDAFASDAGKQTQWLAFTKRARIEQPAPSLFDVILSIKELILPVAEALWSERDFDATWLPNGPWSPRD